MRPLLLVSIVLTACSSSPREPAAPAPPPARATSTAPEASDATERPIEIPEADLAAKREAIAGIHEEIARRDEEPLEGCVRKNAKQCIADGRDRLDPVKGIPRPRLVVSHWEQSCKDGMVEVCVELARAWQAGDLYFAQCPDSFGGAGIETENPERARPLYAKACKAGHRDACAELKTLGRGEPACI